MKSQQLAAAALSLMLAACMPPAPAAPAPTTLTTPKPPIEVVQTAARQLTTQGFDIVTSDATGGILVAKRSRDKTGNADIIACRIRSGSIAGNALRSTLTVNLAATASPAGTAVVIRSTALAQYPGLTGVLKLPDSDTDCVSNGSLEQQLLTLLGATASR